MTEPLPVSVVVVNYNRAELLLACVRSLLVQDRPAAEVIVVDNGSTDGSAEAVEREFGARVRLIRLADNLGFAGGNNRGAREASAEWLALINNDAAADPAWLSRMMDAAERSENTGLVACRVVRGERRELLDNMGVGLWPDGMSRGASHFESSSSVAPESVFMPSGCAMLVRRSAFEEAGGFDEIFFVSSEDTDLGIRLRLSGYSCELADDAVAYHSPGGGTLGMLSARKVYLVERNRLKILFRYFPLRAIIASPFWTGLRYAGLAAAAFSGNGSGAGVLSSLVALVRAYTDGFRCIREDLAKGRPWRLAASVPTGSIQFWMKKHRLDWRSLTRLDEP